MTKAKTLATLVSNNNPLADGTLSVGDVTGLQAELDAKQAALVSGTSIKTVGGTSVLGSGDISVGVTSFNTRTGAVTLSSSDVTTALGYTPATSSDISSAISALVDTAPATLDTLNELAAALGDDPNFATTVTNSLAGKQATLVSGTNIKTVNGTSILGSGNIQIDGGVTSFNTRTGAVTLSSSDVTSALGYTPLSNATSYLPLAGGTMTGVITTVSSGTAINFSGQTDSFGYNATAGLGTYIKGTGSTYLYGGGSFYDGSATRTLLHAGNYNSYTPTLTGGGASGTWGISISGNAATAYGLNVHTGRNNEANKVVRTDGNGYIQAGWINTDSGDNGTTAVSRIYASQDGYIRYYTPANFNTVKNRAIFNRESNGGTMVAGNIYSIYTGGGALTMYLPTVANTAQGDTIWITNLHMTWAANNFTIGKNGNTYINYIAESLVCNVNVAGLTLVCNYHDGTNAFWSAF